MYGLFVGNCYSDFWCFYKEFVNWVEIGQFMNEHRYALDYGDEFLVTAI